MVRSSRTNRAVSQPVAKRLRNCGLEGGRGCYTPHRMHEIKLSRLNRFTSKGIGTSHFYSQSKHKSVGRLVKYFLSQPGQVTWRRPFFLAAGLGRSSGGRLAKGFGTHVHVGSSSLLGTSCSFGLLTSLMAFPPLTDRRSLRKYVSKVSIVFLMFRLG